MNSTPPFDIAAGDTDGDGVEEIAFTVSLVATTGLAFMSADGLSISSPYPGSYLPPGQYPRIALGNLLGDEKAELVTVNGGLNQAGQVRVFSVTEGEVTSSFLPNGAAYFTDDDVAICDLNNDGVEELVIAGAWQIYGSVSDPHFTQPSGSMDYFQGDLPEYYPNSSRMTCADLDGDGHDEIIVGGWPGQCLQIISYPGKPEVVFPGPTSEYCIEFQEFSDLVAGDLNGDGYAEIVTGHPGSPSGYIEAISHVDHPLGGGWDLAGPSHYNLHDPLTVALALCEPGTTVDCVVNVPTCGGDIPGKRACNGGGSLGACLSLQQLDPNIVESWNEQDDDCDGYVDECDPPQTEMPCTFNGTTPGCSSVPGLAQCDATGGGGYCAPVVAGTPDDDCDGNDNDCDGIVDEDSGLRAKSCAAPPSCAVGNTAVCCLNGVDTDGDGMEDFIEIAGEIDLDCDGSPDVVLPADVSPTHKDLFLELDWMDGSAIPAYQIDLLKEVFANAPVSAGGSNNPDGLPGINLWVDTTPGGDFPAGGGSMIAAQSIGRMDERFQMLKQAEFTPPGKEYYFHYGVIARPGSEDPDLNEDGTITVGGGECQNGMDDDGDGRIDGADLQCGIDPVLREDGQGAGSCSDGIDNNPLIDGADALDAECMMIPRENGSLALDSCYDGIDNSTQNRADAADPDCQPGGPGIEDGDPDPNSCTDGIDNGADGLRDGADPSCGVMPIEPGGAADSCTDGMDNDGNGLIDERDPNCAGFPTEDGDGFGSCWDLQDNASDGADNQDSDCTYGGGWGTDGQFIVYNGDPGTLLHEFGHSLGLAHGGPRTVGGVAVADNEINCKAPYISVMNYEHQFGIAQVVNVNGSEDGAGDGTCNDGIDNGGMDGLDGTDTDCIHLSDLNGDGILDAGILDFAPPRFPDLDGNGSADGRATDLTGFVLDESQLNETVVFDAADPYNSVRLADFFGRKSSVPSNGYNLLLNEGAGIVNAGGAPGTCTDGIDNDGINGADGADPSCYGYDYDSNNVIAAMPLISSNQDGADSVTRRPAACIPNEATLANHAGADDWSNLGLPAPGSGSGPPPDYEPEPVFDPVVEARRGVTADLQLRFIGSRVKANVGTPTPAQVRVINRGPDMARNIRVVFEPTAGILLLPGTGSCVLEGASLVCDVGIRAVDGYAVIDVQVVGTLPPPGLIRRLTARVESVSGYDPILQNNSASIPVYVAPSFTSFDEPNDWDVSSVSASGSSHTEGVGSMEIVGCNYVTAESPLFNTTAFEILGDQLLVDVFIPANVPNTYYVGDIQLFFDSFPAGTYSHYMGQVQLTNLPRGVWQTISFQVPSAVEAVFAGDVSRAQLKFAFNTSLCGSEHMLVDNLRFGGTLVARTTPHHATGGRPTAGESVFSFDYLSDWSSNSPLSLETALVVQGSAALLAETNGSTQLTSRQFSSSELSIVTDTISLDLLLKGPAPNPYWIGSVDLLFSCPSASLWDVYLGSHDLSALFFGEYNAVEFSVPVAVQNALESVHSDCQFRLGLYGSPAPEGYYLDNMGFVD